MSGKINFKLFKKILGRKDISNNKRFNPSGRYSNYKYVYTLKQNPKIREAKTDKIGGRHRHFNNNGCN